MSTGEAEPRSSSLLHHLPCQSSGMQASSCASVADRRTTASFSKTGVPCVSGGIGALALHPLPVPLPEVTKTLPVMSSTTTPPAAQKPAPIPGVSYHLTAPVPLVGTAKTQP